MSGVTPVVVLHPTAELGGGAMAATAVAGAAIPSTSPFSAVLQDRRVLDELAAECVAYTAANGITMFKSNHLIHAPCTLLPMPLPRDCYEFVVSLATDYNLLYEAVSRDYDFLVQALAAASAADEFTASLLSILHTVQAEGATQRLHLAINRSDYMLHADSASSALIPLQVEYNTISVSFAGLSTRTAAMHRLLCSRYLSQTVQLDDLPVNRAHINISRAIAETFGLYNTQYGAPLAGRSAVVLMVVQAGEGNAIDQKMIEYELFDAHGVTTIRRTLKQLHDTAALDDSKQLLVDGHVVAVAYFRAGYHPRDYPSADEWSAVLSVERSLCVKCPSVAQHLSGTKKVQQVLTQPGVVERYLEAEAAQRVRRTFAGLWGLEADDEETRRVIADAIAQPREYVLKPQREGGGNNLWEDDMITVLRDASQTPEQRAQYILMRRIRPPHFETAIMREGAYTLGSAISELGIYSAFIGDGDKVHCNEFCGHLLRTKQEGVNEGGVAAGFAALDSPILIEANVAKR